MVFDDLELARVLLDAHLEDATDRVSVRILHHTANELVEVDAHYFSSLDAPGMRSMMCRRSHRSQSWAGVSSAITSAWTRWMSTSRTSLHMRCKRALRRTPRRLC